MTDGRIADQRSEIGKRWNGLLRRPALAPRRNAWSLLDGQVSPDASTRSVLELARSITSEGEARRCFITGISVWPPARYFASLPLENSAAASSTEEGGDRLSRTYWFSSQPWIACQTRSGVAVVQA